MRRSIFEIIAVYYGMHCDGITFRGNYKWKISNCTVQTDNIIITRPEINPWTLALLS